MCASEQFRAKVLDIVSITSSFLGNLLVKVTHLFQDC